MAFLGRSADEQKLEFVRLAAAEEVPFAALCLRFGIGRTCGYKWLGQYRQLAAHAGDRDAVERRVRTPVSTPVEAVAGCLAAGRWDRADAAELAKAASERMRRDFRQGRRALAIVSVKTPGASISAGARLRTRFSRAASCCLIS